MRLGLPAWVATILFGVVVMSCASSVNPDPDASARDVLDLDGGGDLADSFDPAAPDLLCPEAWLRNEEGNCQPGCPAGWSSGDGICVPPCPDGMEAVGALCRLPESAFGPRPCGPGLYDAAGSESSDLVFHVNAKDGLPDGDGSEDRPFLTLSAALKAIASHVPAAVDASVLVAPGVYVESPAPGPQAPSVRLLGSCAADVVIKGTIAVSGKGFSVAIERCTAIPSDTDYGVTVSDSGGLVVRDCDLDGGAALATSGLVWTSDGKDSTLEVDHSRLTGESALMTSGLESVSVVASRLDGWRLGGAVISDASRVQVSDSWIQAGAGADAGATSVAVRSSSGVLAAQVRVLRCWFGTGAARGLAMTGIQGSDAAFEVSGNSFDRLSGETVRFDSCRDVHFGGNRLVGTGGAPGSAAGLLVIGSATVSVLDSIITGVGGDGVGVMSSTDVRVENSRVTGCAGSGVWADSQDGPSDIEVYGTELVGNLQHGLMVEGGRAWVEGSEVGANGMAGIRVRHSTQVMVRESVVAGNGSTGIDYAQLAAALDSDLVVEDNRVQENTGMGIAVRSAGPLTVRVEDNEVVGTRPGRLKDLDRARIADGIVVLTGQDGVGSNVDLESNVVSYNARLGILVHGKETRVKVSGTTLGPGNGYQRIDAASLAVDDKDPNLVRQAGAEIAGTDLPEVLVPLAEIPAAIFLGDGGDPW